MSLDASTPVRTKSSHRKRLAGKGLSGRPASEVHLWLMMILTFTTGINDAVGYLALDKVFTGNMTGNVVILGMALVGESDLPVLGPALALVGFMAGAALAGRVMRRATGAWSGYTSILLLLVAVIMLGLGAVLFVVGRHPNHVLMVSITTIAALGMGVQAAAARRIAVKDVTTVVVTSTITGLAADSWLGEGKKGSSARRLMAVVAILAGATAGAALIELHLAWAMLLAGSLIALVVAVGERHRRLVSPTQPAL